jgi:hypothetical protein
MSETNEGYSPAAGSTDTEAVYGSPGPAPHPNQEEYATTTDTTGTATAGIGAAMPGGSLTDKAPTYGTYGTAGPETGLPGSEYAVAGSAYPGAPGSPDTEGVYGGGTPANWVPASTGLTATLDTTVGGGDYFYSALGTPPAYRAPSSYVAASVKDTSLTDILGNQINAQMVYNTTAYQAQAVDTSYIGAPAAPTSLSTQTDTFTSVASSTPYYLSQRGVVTSTIALAVGGTPAVLNTDYTLTIAGNGPRTAAYWERTSGSTVITVGSTVTATYSWGNDTYYDSNLPPVQALPTTDFVNLTQVPVKLFQTGITTAASALTVVNVRTGATLTYNTDYTVSTVTLPYTPGSTYTETPLATFALTRILSSTACLEGDSVAVTYSYTTSVPSAPGMGAQVAQVDTITLSHTTPAALSKTGIITTAANLVVTDTTTGNVLALTTDYTVTTTGSGSTQTYSITRVNSSVASADGDTATVAYSYGNAYYFTSGPVSAVNRGVVVSWTPPTGTTEVDYYMIMASDGGTMYVPATGEPQFYGQPSPSGGASAGMPTFQSDTITLSSTPAALSKSGVLTEAGQLIVRDITDTSPGDPLQPVSQVLEYGYDYTVTATGTGPWRTYSITRVSSSQNSNSGDSATVDYWWDNFTYISATFTQGLLDPQVPIYTPAGGTRPTVGYQFCVAAGNRAGLGPYSGWSDYINPINPNATPELHPQESSHPANTLDPANTINPVYYPNGTIRSGTGLGG